MGRPRATRTSNDHEDLRHDPLLAILVGQQGPLGDKRAWDQGETAGGLEVGRTLQDSLSSSSREKREPGVQEALKVSLGKHQHAVEEPGPVRG